MTETQTQAAIIQQLLELQAIQVKPDAPFTYASGIKSPIYTDLRMTISKPALRKQIATGLSELIRQFYPTATVIGGVATAGIPHAAWVAEELELPLIYVRSKPKDHGAGKQIEGALQAADQVVLIDDLISTGGSVLKAGKAVRQTSAQLLGVASIFSYQLPDAHQNFAAEETQLHSLIDYHQLIDYLATQQQLTPAQLDSARTWHQNPWQWGATTTIK
ncbi:orotate phosphoribosyltransferase [Pediococcus acidilactici]|uniref:orotate phosphoribosyltransferase n=1 Tax=Pediococcus acidilactici TaxID=1254 RepID=UPI00132BDEFB|nr:orotate phosphoribosyltransferase [Pediococcus acidilactici]KAF0363617.1 orotate phosphoribosyltransferase [Pediococcus acidilactici]KAF0367373.1 orotate phosphoribosyltransferase [Pediococcus acidilactici]KAF0417918.1 orotate phosphoribosyltransferase [Pediococcus acidilactici]KAF0421206.1 orotate phosphoribosyltransferase [Pediococcus acidilactici]KAF0473875.1 orotate phosphoribosyltransferase [Pediococcus acidilactici]